MKRGLERAIASASGATLGLLSQVQFALLLPLLFVATDMKECLRECKLPQQSTSHPTREDT